MDNDDKNSTNIEKVGYKNPPRQHRFQKGRSGNPKGRPPKPRTLQEGLNVALAEEIIITENGKKKKVTMLEALIKKLINGALTDDKQARAIIMKDYGSKVCLPVSEDEKPKPFWHGKINQGLLSDEQYEAEVQRIEKEFKNECSQLLRDAMNKRHLEEKANGCSGSQMLPENKTPS